MYSPLRVFETTVGEILCYVYTLSLCHYAVHEVSVINGGLIECTVNVNAHTLNLNNQYLNLL